MMLCLSENLAVLQSAEIWVPPASQIWVLKEVK